jgi:hypothetical protein
MVSHGLAARFVARSLVGRLSLLVGAHVAVVALAAVLLVSGAPAQAELFDLTSGLPLDPPGKHLDLLILADSSFCQALAPLKQHKDATGVTTHIQSWQSVAQAFANQGRDDPERLKRALALYKKLYGLRYVMLVGDADTFPVRYTLYNRADIASHDFTYMNTDYYYADLFGKDGSFSTWDADADGRYGELNGETVLGQVNVDRVDLTPDLAVGRVPASTVAEVTTYVEKVKRYELGAYGSDWFKKALVAATISPEKSAPTWSQALAADCFKGFGVSRLYETPNSSGIYTPPLNTAGIQAVLNQGVGFVSYTGHGNEYEFAIDAGAWGMAAVDGAVLWWDGLWHNQFCLTGELPATGDFDGDGKDDVVSFVRDAQKNGARGDVRVALSSGTSFGPAAIWHGWFCVGQELPAVGDFNGDGKDDVATFVRNSKTGSGANDVWVALSSGSSFGTSKVWQGDLCRAGELPCVGDVNGDGKDDVISFVRSVRTGADEGDVWVALSTGTGFGTPTKWHNFFCIGTELPRVGDFNGDGKDDIASFVRDSKTGLAANDVWVALSTGSSFGNSSVWSYNFCGPGELPEIGDFNGDGKDDFASFVHGARSTGDGKAVYVGISTGAKIGTVSIWNDSFCPSTDLPGVGDFDGDGYADAASFHRDHFMEPQYGDVAVARSLPLRNKDRLPVIFADACDTAKYAPLPPSSRYVDTNGTIHAGIDNGETFTGVAPYPAAIQPAANDLTCLAEYVLVSRSEGAVGYVGCNTGAQCGWELNTRFFKAYSQGAQTLGDMWASAVYNYYLAYPDPGSLKTADWYAEAEFHQPWKFNLFGDPSLRVGGVTSFGKAAFVGTWEMAHDGWKGELTLSASLDSYVDNAPNLVGTYYRATDGATFSVRGYVRTWRYPLAASWGPDHQIEFFIDFAKTANNRDDDQRFQGFLYSGTKDAMAGRTWWNGIPFGFYAVKKGTGSVDVTPAPRASDKLSKADFVGAYAMTHDGWQGTLLLNAQPDDPIEGSPNVIGTYTTSDGQVCGVRGWVRTPSYYKAPSWGPDHQIEFFIDFARTPTDYGDDQRFLAYLFSGTRNALAGVTWWRGTPFGMHAVKQ